MFAQPLHQTNLMPESGAREATGKFMDRLSRIFLIVTLLLPATCLAQITAEQAQTMPLPGLAKTLLGESGKIMIDVDRPKFPNVLVAVKFYSHATVTGSQFGLCGADWVTVDFNKHGLVDMVRAERRYGVAGNIYPASSNWTYEESGRICKSVKSTRGYFPAPDPQSALEIAWYVDAIAGQGPFANQSFNYSCAGRCAKDRDDLKWLRLDKITSTRNIDCPKSNLNRPICFEVTVGENEVGPFPKTFRIYGTTYTNKVEVVISNVVVDVGSTLE